MQIKHYYVLFQTQLPISARDIYYRDQIGNISTSNVQRKAKSLEVELRPRFPLFGGWKTDYVLGYNVPSVTFLHNKGEDYALKIPFVDHIYDNVVIEKAVVKIAFPETSKYVILLISTFAYCNFMKLLFTFLATSN